ncbi:MAG TPA: hypothetical protein VH478_23000 [Trebonia sp.]|nr:hypothetical protein [Trebonia sp.]
MRHHRRLRATACAVLTGGLAAGPAACSSGAPARPGDVITVSSNQCGSSWHVPGPGWRTFQIDNQGTTGGEVDLIGPANGAIYAEVENSGPGTTTPMRLNLGSGTYASSARSPTSTR